MHMFVVRTKPTQRHSKAYFYYSDEHFLDMARDRGLFRARHRLHRRHRGTDGLELTGGVILEFEVGRDRTKIVNLVWRRHHLQDLCEEPRGSFYCSRYGHIAHPVEAKHVKPLWRTTWLHAGGMSGS